MKKPRKLVFSTNNEHKLEEVKAILEPYYQILSLKDIGDDTDIPETGETLEDNALIKANYLWDTYHTNCFADDTGLEVEALNNAPGVYSARYAGEQKSSTDNVAKLLKELEGKENRNAQFRTVIALIIDGKKYVFEGKIKGVITTSARGNSGFGYDPVMYLPEYGKCVAELDPECKNRISHRGKALRQLAYKYYGTY